MSKQKIIPLVIFIIAAVALAVWGFFIFKDRYSNNNTTIKNTSIENKPSEENSNANLSDIPQPVEPDNTSDTTAPSVPETASLMKIEREDCLNGCKRFSVPQELTYCKQSCGLTTIQDNPGDCADKSGLDKDYCFKDLAVKNKDFNVCEKISDKGIKRTCITRITENLLNEQMQNSPQLPN